MGYSRNIPGRVAASAALVWVAIGCNFDEAALYDEPPWYPGVIDGDAAAWNACLRANCSPEHRACTAHEDCFARLRCAAECSDPNCTNACDSEAFIRQRACELDRGQGPGSAPCVEGFDRREALVSCAEAHCELECRVGRNWGCVSAYTWPAANYHLGEDQRVTVRYEPDSFGDQAFLGGVPSVDVHEIRGAFETYKATTEFWGWAEYEQSLIGGLAPTLVRLVGKDLSFPIKYVVDLGRPRVRDDAVRTLVIAPNKFPFLFKEDVRPNPARANVGVVGKDCLSTTGGLSAQFKAADVELTLEGATFERITSWNLTEFWHRVPTADSNSWFLNVVPTGGPVDVVMWRNGREVGRTPDISVKDGWITTVYVMPKALE